MIHNEITVIFMGARYILNKLKWGVNEEIISARVTIAHGGVPENKLILDGCDVMKLDRGFMRVNTPEEEVEIPHHRITRIEVEGSLKYQKSGI